MSKSIVKACVRYNDRLYTGFDHGECFKKLNEDNTIIIHSDIEQGFVDSDGNFVDRKQAMIIAKESSQLRYEPNKKTLISEDLHLDWLNKQAQRISELEEQLKNAIVPKFEVGQTLFRMDFGSIVPFLVNEIYGHIKADKTISIQYFDYVGLVIEENELFATREEAEQKLAEIGEKYE